MHFCFLGASPNFLYMGHFYVNQSIHFAFWVEEKVTYCSCSIAAGLSGQFPVHGVGRCHERLMRRMWLSSRCNALALFNNLTFCNQNVPTQQTAVRQTNIWPLYTTQLTTHSSNFIWLKQACLISCLWLLFMDYSKQHLFIPFSFYRYFQFPHTSQFHFIPFSDTCFLQPIVTRSLWIYLRISFVALQLAGNIILLSWIPAVPSPIWAWIWWSSLLSAVFKSWRPLTADFIRLSYLQHQLI